MFEQLSIHMSQIDTEELSKLYYTIGEVADMLNISTSLIRFWESEFTYLKPHKNSKGDRRFTKQNIEQLQLIHHLVKEKGFTLEGAKKEIKDNKARVQAKNKALNTLQHLKSKLLELKSKLNNELPEEE